MIFAKYVVWLTYTLITQPIYGQPSAALWKDQLFVAVNGANVYRGTFIPGARRIVDPVTYSNPSSADINSAQAKLDIRDDRLLLLSGEGSHHIFPMVEVPLLERNEFGEKLLAARGHRDFLTFADLYDGKDSDLLFPEHRGHDVPVKGGVPGSGRVPEAEYLASGRYSIQIAGPKSVRLFHAHKDKLFVSVEPDYLTNWYRDKEGHVKEDLPKPPDRRLRTGKLPADFKERFAVYTAAKRDYLVTPNGKAYMVVAKGRTEVEVSVVWNDPNRRIVGVVQDLENEAVYGWGFVTNSRAPERFYVKLDAKPVAVAYKRSTPLLGDCPDAYLESYECARVFRKAREKK